MPGRLQGRIAIVTGGASSIGRAICLTYAEEGAKVVVADMRSDSRAPGESTPTHEEIKKNGGEAIYIETDVTKLESVEAVVKQTVEKYGRLGE